MALWNVALPMSIEAEDQEAAIDIFVTSLARHDQYAYTYRIEDAATGEIFYFLGGEVVPESADIVQQLLRHVTDEGDDDEETDG